MEFALRRLRADSITPVEKAALTDVILGAPAYSMLVRGQPPAPTEVDELLNGLPPAYTAEDKYFFGVYQGARMIGCVDVLKGWKDPQQSMIGLLLLREDLQGQGIGRRVFETVEQMVRSWHGMTSLRIGVVNSNAPAIAFWRRMGFLENGVAVQLEGYLGKTLIFEKPL